MIGLEYLSSFGLKPIETVRDWENACRWKLYFESEIYRRRYADEALSETITMELTLFDVVQVLEIMINHFDRNHWSIVAGDVMKEIRVRMQRQGFRNRDLVEEIGSKGYVSDILNRRKPLTLRTARIFRDLFDIPAEWLLSDYWDRDGDDGEVRSSC